MGLAGYDLRGWGMERWVCTKSEKYDDYEERRGGAVDCIIKGA